MGTPKKDPQEIINSFMFSPPKEEVNTNDPSKDELLLKIIDEVFSKDDIEVKTELNDAQIIAFSRGKLYAKTFKVPIIDELVDLLSVYSVSKGRKSRKEFKEIAQALNSMQSMEEDPTVRGRLLGKE